MFSGFSAAWILFSDRLIAQMSIDLAELSRMSSLKGILYVVVTASLLYATSHRAITKVIRREAGFALERERERQRLTLAIDRLRVLAMMLDEQLEPVQTVGPIPRWQTGPLNDVLTAVRQNPSPEAGWQGLVVDSGSGPRRLEVSLTPVDPGLSDTARYLCLVRDVTVFHLLKEEHRVAHAQLQAIIDASPMGMAVVDHDGRIRFWSRSAERLLGYTAEEAMGRRLHEFQEPGTDHLTLALGATPLAGEPANLVRREGGHLTARIWTAPLTTPGEADGHVILAADQTEAKQMQDALQHYRMLVDHAEEIFLFMNEQGRILDANPAAVRFYGYSLEELRRLSIVELRAGPQAAAEAQHNAEGGTVLKSEAVHRRRDGQEVVVEVSWFTAESLGKGMLVSMIRDITPRKRQQAYRDLIHQLDRAVLQGASAEQVMALATRYRTPWLTADSADCETLDLVERQVESALTQAADQRRLHTLEAALRASANGVVITDADGVIIWVNPAFTLMTGYIPSEAVGQTPRLLKSEAHSNAFYADMWRTISAGRVWQGEIRNRRKDGTHYDEEMTITPVCDQGRITHYIAIKNDATQRKEREAQIERLRTTDATTGLMNRSRLLSLLADLDRQSEEAALVVLDIDQLQHVNQSLGYDAGDRLLSHVAGVINRVAEGCGFAARLKDDEFALVIWGSAAAGKEAADRVRDQLAGDSLTLEGIAVEFSVSAGVAPLAPSVSVTQAELQAEQALAEAKRSGGNRCLVYTPEMMESSNLMQWSMALRHALRTDGFEIHYQPVIRLGDGRITHAEALIRMRDPNGTLLNPSLFLPMADRLHLMSRIDQWVISTVIARLLEHRSLQVFINLSGQSLNDMDLLREIRIQLEREPGIAERITFEITEATAIRNVTATRTWMSGMQSIGVHFALDDFGTGFSSFAYLRDLPVEVVKLDGSFVRGIEGNPTNQALVRSAVNAARSLGKHVVAEWVETDEAAKLLADLGVDYGQGFGLAMPSPDLSWAREEG